MQKKYERGEFNVFELNDYITLTGVAPSTLALSY